MAKANDKNPDLKLLSSKDRVTPTEFAQARCEPHILIDVRSKQEFDICHIQNSVNVPIKSIESGKGIKLFIEEIAGDDAIRLGNFFLLFPENNFAIIRFRFSKNLIN